MRTSFRSYCSLRVALAGFNQPRRLVGTNDGRVAHGSVGITSRRRGSPQAADSRTAALSRGRSPPACEVESLDVLDLLRRLPTRHIQSLLNVRVQ
jgi:hypothetical protein